MRLNLYKDNSLLIEEIPGRTIALSKEEVEELKEFLTTQFPFIDYKQVKINSLKKQIQGLQEELAKIEND